MKNLGERELAREIIKAIEESKKPKSKTQSKMSIEAMQAFLKI